MKPEIHFPESSKAERRWEHQFDNPKPATPELQPMVEGTVIPARFRNRPLPRKCRKPRIIKATMALPSDVANPDEIDWS